MNVIIMQLSAEDTKECLRPGAHPGFPRLLIIRLYEFTGWLAFY